MRRLFAIFIALCPALNVLAQARGLQATAAVREGLMNYQPANCHVIAIGINDYRFHPRLGCAVNDATAIADTLQSRFGYSVQRLTDAAATRAGILGALEDGFKLGPDDSLIIYFAGHGWVDAQKRGYWIPADAKADSTIDYISNNQLVHDYFAKYCLKHLLVISDSCFSGILLRSLPLADPDDWQLAKAFSKPSRWIMTSGDLSPVPDGTGLHSPFAERLLQYLQYSDKPAFGVRDLFTYVRNQIGQGQEPIAEPLDVDLHVHGGEFVFVRLDQPQAIGPQPLPASGTLVLTTAAGGLAAVDGAAPCRIAKGSWKWALPAGRHHVRIDFTLQGTWAESVNIVSGQETRIAAGPLVEIEPSRPQRLAKRPRYFGPRVGASTFTGMIGAEILIGKIGIGGGMLPIDGPFPTGGIRYYFSAPENSWWVGLSAGGGSGTVDDNYEEHSEHWAGAAVGYRWISRAGWSFSIGAGAGPTDAYTKEADPAGDGVEEDSSGIGLVGDLTLGWSL